MLRNLVLLIAMALAGGAGFWAGGWSGRDAKQTLAKAEAAGKAAQAAHDQAKAELEQRIQALTDDFRKESEQLRQASAQREKDMDTVISQRERRIAELDRLQTGKQVELLKLRAAAATAKTPEERVRIVKEIERVEVEGRTILVEADGRKCQAVPVPDDLLAAWRGGTP